MAPVGPQLPSLKNEKRKRDGTDSESESSSDAGYGPTFPAGTIESNNKRTRVIGPALPPPSAATEQGAQDDNSSSSDSDDNDDDDFGPSLPPADADTSVTAEIITSSNGPQLPNTSATAPKRDDWMLVPPSGGDWTGRVDPTKLKNRKFNTGKGAKALPSSAGGATDSWHETPQEKQARLQREMMGIKDSPAQSSAVSQPSGNKIDAETARRLKEYNKTRGPTLYEAHQTTETIEKDDDPSARAFDREKDIGGGLQVNATQRRQMLTKAADFNTKFSSAKYL